MIFHFFLALIFTHNVFAQSNLSLSGLPPETANRIQNMVDEMHKNPNNYALVDAIIKKLMETGNYDNVEAHFEDGKIKIVTKALRKISRIFVEGNNVLPQEEVLKIIQINATEGFDRKKILESAQRLKEEYQEIGYINAVIEVNFNIESNDQIAVIFKINEGKPCNIKAIHFNTPNKFLVIQLNKIAKSFINKRFTNRVLTELAAEANEYFLDNRYLNSSLQNPEIIYSPERTSAEISYEVQDPYKIHFLFKGNSKNFADIDLLNAISPTSTGQLGFNLPVEAANRVKDYYLNRGHAYVIVSQQVRVWEDAFRREIHITIQEGPKVSIGKFFIHGQISRPPEFYSNFIKDHSSDMIESGYYVEKDLEKGYKNLVTELRNQGYFRAKVQSHGIIESDSRKTVDVQVTLFEGPLTIVDDIKIVGNKAFSQGELEKTLYLERNGPLHLNKLEDSIRNLKQFYFDRGYLEMQITDDTESLVTYNKTNTKANITIKITEGTQVYVSSIVVDGNDLTRNSVIMRELDFKPGEILTPEKIDSSVTALQRLGLFSKIEIDTLEKGTNISQRTVIVRVSEKNPGIFKFGVGVSNDNHLNLRAYTGVSYRNIQGTARAASLRVEVNRAIAPLNGSELTPGEDFLEKKITAGYFEPFLFRHHVDGRLNLTSSEYLNPAGTINDDNDIVSVHKANSLDMLLEKNLTKHTKLTWEAYGFSRERDVVIHGDADSSESVDIARIGPTIDVDHRDDPFNPTKGYFFRYSLDYSHPKLGSSQTVNFVKMTSTFSTFVPIFKTSWNWANSIRGGYVSNLSTEPEGAVPSAYTFFLGGRSTIRGFNPQTESIPRLAELPNVTKITDFSLQGDSHFYLIKTELRFPIYGAIGGTIFYDGGAVIIPALTFSDYYRDAAGFGLRIATPVGPVNFELAYKLDPIKDVESKWQFHFSIGSF